MILFKDISYLDENYNIISGSDILIKDGKIDKIETGIEERDATVYSGNHRLVFPAFYNSHTHSPMTLMRGYGEGLSLKDWLFNKIFPFEDKLSEGDCYYGTLLSAAEMMSGGCVSFSDMYYFADEIVRAVLESGMKANICRPVVSFDEKQSMYDDYRIKEVIETLERFRGDGDGRIVIDASIHAEYTSTERIVKELAEFARERNLSVHVHVSETASEHEECKERHEGRTPVQYFSDCGLFDGRTIAAHCVYVTDGDMDILKERGVFVAHCPQSNLKLGSGIAPVAKLLDKGVRVAIGTDGASSNNNLDMVEEMRCAVLLQRGVNRDPLAFPVKEVIRAATLNGALAQGRNDCGVIKEGYAADLFVIDTDKPHYCPAHDMLSNVMFAGASSDVVLTVCNGEIVYKNGEFMNIDIEKVKAEVAFRSQK